jgi:hypothetical protein
MLRGAYICNTVLGMAWALAIDPRMPGSPN